MSAQNGAQGRVWPSLPEVLRQHRLSFIKHGCRCGDPAPVDEWAEHVGLVWREACTIRTAEDVLNLPAGCVLHANSEGAIELFSDGHWYLPGRRDAVSIRRVLEALPAQLVHHPDWSQP